jgi:hypothetical protein
VALNVPDALENGLIVANKSEIILREVHRLWKSWQMVDL